MKIDLDDLERKAKAEIATRSAAPRSIQGDLLVTQEVANASWDHSRAVSAPVTLALIARIRELEAQARRTIDATGLTVEDELEVLSKLLEKGAVLP